MKKAKKLLAALLAACLLTACLPLSASATTIPNTAVEFGGHYYQLVKTAMSWKNAQAYCQKQGGHLATITSQEEQDFIYSYLSGKKERSKYMIGLHRDIDKFGTWVTGEKVTYTNWAQGEPDNLGKRQDVVVLVMFSANGNGYKLAPGKWDDDNTGSNYYFICEWDYVSSNWANSDMEKAYEENLVPDVLIGKDLTKPITRAEFAAVAVKTYENLSGVKALPATVNPFKDCSDLEVLKAYNLGVVLGTSLTAFEPGVRLNREQAAAMLTRVFKRATMPGWSLQEDAAYPLAYEKPANFADDAAISNYARESVYFMAANNIIKGVGNNKFAPRNTTSAEEANGYANATREQALAIAVRMVENLK